MTRNRSLLLATAALLLGAGLTALPPLHGALHRLLGERPLAEPAREPAPQPAPAEGVVAMTEAQRLEAGISLATAGPGRIARRLALPATIIASGDRLVRVPARVAGIVTELHRRPGDPVAAGDLLAVVESREIADARAEYLAALQAEQLARSTFEREQRLWDRRISAEQDFLRARAEAAAARIRLTLAQQKLAALGLGAAEVAALPGLPAAQLPRREIRAPIAGRVTERNLDLGGAVTPETQAFAVVDLSVVWVETAVPAADLGLVREGEAVTVTAAAPPRTAEARLIFVSPTLDNQTRAARAVAELPNPEGAWRPGSFATASIAAPPQPAAVLVPRAALQRIGGEPVVFVRTAPGFERRAVRPGREDAGAVEILAGLAAGEAVAVDNAFLLKAELGKAEE